MKTSQVTVSPANIFAQDLWWFINMSLLWNMRNITLTFYLNTVNYGCKNVCPFKGNVGCFGVCCRKPFVMWTIKRVFAWQWKFMVALLCPNNSHIVSRTDSPAENSKPVINHTSLHIVQRPPSAFFFFFSPPRGKKLSSVRKMGSFWILSGGFFFFLFGPKSTR